MLIVFHGKVLENSTPVMDISLWIVGDIRLIELDGVIKKLNWVIT